MARRVFFSFHYERDIWRANVVRNSWVTQDREAAGFWDASLWEEAKKQGDEAIKRMINRGLENTSVTAVLIRSETASREWVQYEIKRSYERLNGLLGIFIDGIKVRASRYARRKSLRRALSRKQWPTHVSFPDLSHVRLGSA